MKTVLLENVFKDVSPLAERIKDVSELTVIDYSPEAASRPEVKEADALLLVNQKKSDAEFIDTLKNCRLICRCGVGYENVDAEYAAKKGIYVANAPGYCDDEVSDHAVALMLAMERRLFKSDSGFRETHRYNLSKIRGIGGLRGKTAGIIGLGATGRLTAKKLTAFGMNVLYYHPRRHNDVEGNGFTAKWSELDALFAAGDYVILHATSTPETFHMVNEHTLSLMKPTAGIVNVARGELIDTAALNAALSEHRIACAGLDVFEGSLKNEWNIELFKQENTILTPHSAWLSENAERRLLEIIGDNVCDAAEGKVPRNCVNFDHMG